MSAPDPVRYLVHLPARTAVVVKCDSLADAADYCAHWRKSGFDLLVVAIEDGQQRALTDVERLELRGAS